MEFRGEVLSEDGTLRFPVADAREVSTAGEAYDFGFTLGEVLRAEIGGRITFDA